MTSGCTVKMQPPIANRKAGLSTLDQSVRVTECWENQAVDPTSAWVALMKRTAYNLFHGEVKN